jgi:predicted protein tyrosine phosphatase
MTNSVELRVAGLHNLQDELRHFRPTHVVSLVNPDLPDAAFMPWIDGVQHLVLRFYDVHREGGYRVSQDAEGPTKAHVIAVVDFIRMVLASPPPVRLLTHCHAGASRSTATAYIALALRDGPGHERDTFRELMVVTRKPWPSRLITAMADELLERNGAMLAPLDAYRAKHPHRLAAFVRLYQRRMRAMP